MMNFAAIPVNVSITPPHESFNGVRVLNTSDLGKCCAACLEDGDRCKYWFVPTNTSDITDRGVGTMCVLVGSVPSGGAHTKGGCIGQFSMEGS